MTVEITEVVLNQGVVSVSAVDCSEEHLQRMERQRDDGMERVVEFVFDTHKASHYHYLYKWLKRQKAAKAAKTWGEALFSVMGTVTSINSKYRVWD